LGLTCEDIDLTNQTLTVRRSLSIIGRELRFQEPKTESSKRTIAVGPATIASLKAHRQNQTEARLAVESWDDEMNLVFSRADGRPIRPDYVTKRLRRLVQNAGLEWIRLHGLRHTMASIALQNGTDIATVSERLGHSDTNVTARIYLHGSVESDRLAASALDDVLHG
jgi:integrase